MECVENFILFQVFRYMDQLDYMDEINGEYMDGIGYIDMDEDKQIVLWNY